MNVNTMYNDGIRAMSDIKDKVVDKYNSTNINPFPKNIMNNFAKLGKLVETTMKKALK